VDELAQAILGLLKDPDRRRSISERSQAVAQSRFTLNRMVDDIEKIYESAWQ
jgi:glycosyltransferase involved in cell wall biosynthesis